jgi:membrane protein YqaA with SNARE-associated domain
MQRITDLIHRFGEFMQHFAEQLGGPGLAVVAFLDSSFLSLPEVNDILIVLMVLRHPDGWLYYAAMTTIGSIAGCYALYSLARRGGEAFLRKRFSKGNLDRALNFFQKYGLLAVIIPSILPPPTPFKIFVLLSGVARVRRSTFLLAVAIGRGFRYGSEGLLAYLYGDQATRFIKENLGTISLWLAVGVGVLGVAFVLWRKYRTA